MKRKCLVLILLGIPFLSNAQFTQNGSDLYHPNGNVGIGTNSPLSRFHIVDGTGVLRTTDNGDGIVLTSFDHLKSIGLSSSSNGNYGGTGSVGLKLFNGEVKYIFGGYEKVTFKSDGKVGIGTTSPSAQLEVQQSGEGAIIMKSLVQGSYGAANIIVDAANGFPGRFIFRENGVNKGWLSHRGSGNMISFRNSSSDPLMNIKMDNGNVGIGTTNPLSNLHIEGDMRVTRLGSAGLVSKIIAMGTRSASASTVHAVLRSGTGDGASFNSWNGGLSSWFGIGFHSDFDNTTRGVFNTRNGDFSIKGKFSAEGAGSNYFAGNVGIGTTTHEPGSKLTVAGKIHSREVKVTVDAGRS